MCCEDDLLPAAVSEMLAGYRVRLAERGYDWGDDLGSRLVAALAAVMSYGRHTASARDRRRLRSAFSLDGADHGLDDWTELVDLALSALPDPLPSGVAVATRTGIRTRTPLPYVLDGVPLTYRLFTRGDGVAPLAVSDVVVDEDHLELDVDGHRVVAAVHAASGRMRLVADGSARWTVLDDRGGAWFPDNALHKYDYHGRPYFHGNDVTLTVPAGRLAVSVARGCEFRPVSTDVDVAADQEMSVQLSPERLYDAASLGWYGADLHVHMNYSGDLVCTPGDAARMQAGEGLHLMNLVAANCRTSLIYDREAFERFAGEDLPWTQDNSVARWGIEYRNDLLGHFTALDLPTPPTRYQTGHLRSEQPQDWPPNADAAAECRDSGATVSYTHPVLVGFDDGGPSEVFEDDHAHLPCARELVADAALGLVDSVDLTGAHLGHGTESTEYLYHRLLGCGLRLAATAGTDAMLSRSRSHVASNPPGWSRAYANLDGQPLTVDAWKAAMRDGRTFTTNGPWLEFDVDERGLGATVRLDVAGRVRARARVVGLGVETLEIVGPEGSISNVEVEPGIEQKEIAVDITVQEPMWLAAVARGGEHPAVLCPQTYAHTSPVWIEVDGESVARREDATWCIDWLNRFEALVRRVGRFPDVQQLDELVDVIDRAREFYRAIAETG
jgi:hypothetical protein